MIAKKLQLVLLAGGRSSRMGQDKTYLKLDDHKGLDFFENAFELLLNLKQQYSRVQNNSISSNENREFSLAISCREEQQKEMIQRVEAYFIKSQNRKKPLCEICLQKNLAKNEQGIFSIISDHGIGVCEAIIECLEKSEHDCLFIPCDVPFLNITLLERLVNAWLIAYKNDKNMVFANFVFQEGGMQEAIIQNSKKKNQQESLIAIYTQNALPYLLECVQKNAPLQNAIPTNVSQKILYTNEEEVFFQNINRQEDFIKITTNECVLRNIVNLNH